MAPYGPRARNVLASRIIQSKRSLVTDERVAGMAPKVGATGHRNNASFVNGPVTKRMHRCLSLIGDELHCA